MKWLLILIVALLFVWGIFHNSSEAPRRGLTVRPQQTPFPLFSQKGEVPSGAPSSSSPKYFQSRSQEVKPDSEFEKLPSEAKRDIVFLNDHQVDNIEVMVENSKPWSSLPGIKNKQGLLVLVCGAGDVKFKKGVKNPDWHIVFNANYRGVDPLENFGSVAILQRGDLKSFHTSDEKGVFLVDPNDVTHFVIKVSKILYIQLFSMLLGPNDDVHYVYAGNIYIQDEEEKKYKRMGVVLFRPCQDKDAQWESFTLPTMDNLTIQN